MPDISGYFSRNERAPRGHLKGIRDDQPHVPIDPTALVPPTLEPPGIDEHRNRVLFADANIGGDVQAKSRVSARMLLDKLAINEDDCVAIDAAEVEPYGLVLRRLRHQDC